MFNKSNEFVNHSWCIFQCLFKVLTRLHELRCNQRVKRVLQYFWNTEVITVLAFRASNIQFATVVLRKTISKLLQLDHQSHNIKNESSVKILPVRRYRWRWCIFLRSFYFISCHVDEVECVYKMIRGSCRVSPLF